MKISLCIATYKRYAEFLSKYLPKYLNNTYIDEIIITDDDINGSDKIAIDKFLLNYRDNRKKQVKTYVNKVRLGPLHNKLKAMSLASNEWICLMDSDNFADIDYFKAFMTYFNSNRSSIKNETIFAPSFAKPRFDYRELEGLVINKSTLSDCVRLDKNKILKRAMNTGNYIINKTLIDRFDLSKETVNCEYAADVIYFNTILFEDFDIDFIIVPGMHYTHVVHKGSIYLQTHKQSKEFCKYTQKRFDDLISK